MFHQHSDVYNDVIDELNNATRKYPNWPTDMLHAVAVVNEESGELTRAVLNHVYHGDSIEDIRLEAIQTTAMAIRFLENLDA